MLSNELPAAKRFAALASCLQGGCVPLSALADLTGRSVIEDP